MSVGARPRQGQRRRIISMSETIATVRRKRLISSGSVIEGDGDQILRGSPGNFHPPLYASRESIEVQEHPASSTSRNISTQRLITKTQSPQLSSLNVNSEQQSIDETDEILRGKTK